MGDCDEEQQETQTIYKCSEQHGTGHRCEDC